MTDVPTAPPAAPPPSAPAPAGGPPPAGVSAAGVPAAGVPGGGPPAADGFMPLDPRALRLWQITDVIAYAVVLFIGLVVGGVVAWTWRGALPWAAALWVALAGLAVWTVLFYHPRNYRAWGYSVDRRVLLIRQGVWFRSVKLLPLPRLQHVDVKRGPLQRRYGLATLVLHTAGTHAASIEVPGLDADEAVRLRDHLVAAGGDDGV